MDIVVNRQTLQLEFNPETDPSPESVSLLAGPPVGHEHTDSSIFVGATQPQIVTWAPSGTRIEVGQRATAFTYDAVVPAGSGYPDYTMMLQPGGLRYWDSKSPRSTTVAYIELSWDGDESVGTFSPPFSDLVNTYPGPGEYTVTVRGHLVDQTGGPEVTIGTPLATLTFTIPEV